MMANPDPDVSAPLDLEPIKAHIEPWHGCPGCQVRELIAEVERLRAEVNDLDNSLHAEFGSGPWQPPYPSPGG